MDGRKRAGMSCIQRLEKVKRLAASYFSDQDAIRAMTQSGAQQIPDGHRGPAWLLTARLKFDQILQDDFYFGCLLDQHDSLRGVNESRQGFEHRRFSG